jgi:phosphocarrier protein HPr
MPSTSVVVGSRVGLHARPAAIISEAAMKTGSTVTIATDGGEPVDAGSALLIMTLGAKCGDTVVVSSDDEQAMRTIADLVVQDLDV